MHYCVHALQHIYITRFPSFSCKYPPPFYMFTTCNRMCFKLTAYVCKWLVSLYLMNVLYSVIVWIFIMALVIYNVHIIHFHMDPYMIGDPGSELLCTPLLSGSSLLDPDHLTSPHHNHTGEGTTYMGGMSGYSNGWYATCQMVPPATAL